MGQETLAAIGCSGPVAEVFVRGIGGRYSRIAAGHPTGFNPLALPDTASNRAFLRDWLGVMLAATGPTG